MPVLVSAALLQSAAAAEPQGLLQALASSGFADTTRIGGGNPELGSLMARCNRKAVQEALAAYARALQQLSEQVEREDWTALQQALTSGSSSTPQFSLSEQLAYGHLCREAHPSGAFTGIDRVTAQP